MVDELGVAVQSSSHEGLNLTVTDYFDMPSQHVPELNDVVPCKGSDHISQNDSTLVHTEKWSGESTITS